MRRAVVRGDVTEEACADMVRETYANEAVVSHACSPSHCLADSEPLNLPSPEIGAGQGERAVSRDYEPTPGQWYENLEEEESFRVLSVDEDSELIEIEYLDGDIEEIDLETWHEMDLELTEEPEGWSDPDEDEDEEDEDEEDEEDEYEDEEDEEDEEESANFVVVEALTTYVEGYSEDLDDEEPRAEATDDVEVGPMPEGANVDAVGTLAPTAATAESAAPEHDDEGSLLEAPNAHSTQPQLSHAAAEDAAPSGEESDSAENEVDSDEDLSRVETG